jgi:hypothetical protein
MGKCEICGKPTKRNYPLCTSCYNAFMEGVEETMNTIDETKSRSADADGTCLICHQPVKAGKHFCLDCYNKYKKKILFVKIEGCKKTEVVTSDFPCPETANDGHKVRSKSEKTLDDYFYLHDIKHRYEPSVFLSNSNVEPLRPDFLLENFKGNTSGKGNVYIEHFGGPRLNEDRPAYLKRMETKKLIYEKLLRRPDDPFTLVCFEESDTKGSDEIIEHKLRTFKWGEINFWPKKMFE